MSAVPAAARSASSPSSLDAALRAALPAGDEALRAARLRPGRLPADGSAPAAILPFLAASAALAAGGPWGGRPAFERLVDALAAETGLPGEAARLQLFSLTLAELATRPDAVDQAVRRVLELVCRLVPAAGASAWVLEPAAVPPLRCVDAVGSHAGRRGRLVATAARGLLADRALGPDCAVAMDHRAGVVVARIEPAARARGTAFLGLAAQMLRLRLEEARLRSTSGAQQQTLVEAAERRLIRLGLDLHDGPAQTVAALAADARVVRGRLEGLEAVPAPALAFLDEAVERLDDIGEELRDLAGSLEARSVVRRPLEATLRQELGALGRRSGLRTSCAVSGDLTGLTTSQRVAIVRVAQEALANVREHSGATRVDVVVRRADGATRLEIADDGRGFDVVRARDGAARRGRLGLAGMRERIALLGGGLDLVSRPGGPTIVRVVLPDWAPSDADASA